MAKGIVERMVNRVWFVGSSEQTAPQIEASFQQGVAQLEVHLAGRPYLFGARPAFGDFGLWGQVYNAWTDPTCGEIIDGKAPSVVAWIERMLEPKAEGAFEEWSALEPTLLPFLRDQVGTLFLPWSDANARALAEGEERVDEEEERHKDRRCTQLASDCQSCQHRGGDEVTAHSPRRGGAAERPVPKEKKKKGRQKKKREATTEKSKGNFLIRGLMHKLPG